MEMTLPHIEFGKYKKILFPPYTNFLFFVFPPVVILTTGRRFLILFCVFFIRQIENLLINTLKRDSSTLFYLFIKNR
jgi:hypothetical protein